MKKFILCFTLIFTNSVALAFSFSRCPSDKPLTPSLQSKNNLAASALNFLEIEIDDVTSLQMVPNSYHKTYVNTSGGGVDVFKLCRTGGQILDSIVFRIEIEKKEKNCLIEVALNESIKHSNQQQVRVKIMKSTPENCLNI